MHKARDVAVSKGRNYVSQSLNSTAGSTIIGRASCSREDGGRVWKMKRKTVVSFVLVVLFLVSVFPLSTFSGAADSHGSPTLESQSTVDPTDWWPMFHRDLMHNGYSTSNSAEHKPNSLELHDRQLRGSFSCCCWWCRLRRLG